jgi:general secretion pathway protein C
MSVPQIIAWIPWRLAAPRALAAMLGLLLVLQIAEIPYRAPVMQSRPDPGNVTSDLSSIARAHLFGVPATLLVENAPAIAMKLSGVIATSQASRGFAILSVGDSKAGFYIAGHVVPDGSVLREVYKDRVVLERGGTRRELRLPEQRTAAGLALQASAAADGDEGGAVAALPEQGIQQRIVVGGLPPGAGAVRALRPEAVVSGGKLRGYQVYPSDPEQLGVHSGDELVAVNGKAFTDPHQAAALMQSLESWPLDHVELTLIHAGETYQVAIDTQSLRRHRP